MTNDDQPRFEDPPLDARRRVDWEAMAALARTRPGQWLRIPGDHSAAVGSNAVVGPNRNRAFRDGRWEYTRRYARSSGRYLLWIRYMGSEEAL